MLTIKKRFPYNKLYISGSLAFIAGFGAVMVIGTYFSPQRYSADQLATNVSTPKQVEQQKTTSTESDNADTNNASSPVWTAPVMTPTQPSTTTPPVTETPTTVVTPEVPVVTVPEVPVEVPTVPEVPVIPPVIPDPVEIIEDLLGSVTTP